MNIVLNFVRYKYFGLSVIAIKGTYFVIQAWMW